MADMTHGTRWVYAQGCRCEPCRAAESSYRRTFAKGLIPGLVDAGPARVHLEALQARGLGMLYLAVLAGVSPGTVRALLQGRARVSLRVASRILAVVDPPLANGCRATFADSYGARSQLRRMLEEGYPPAWLQQRLGFAVGRLVRSKGKGVAGRRVRLRTVRVTHAAYAQLVLGGIPEGEIDGPTC